MLYLKGVCEAVVPVGRQTTIVIGLVYQNAALRQSLLSTIDLLQLYIAGADTSTVDCSLPGVSGIHGLTHSVKNYAEQLSGAGDWAGACSESHLL